MPAEDINLLTTARWSMYFDGGSFSAVFALRVLVDVLRRLIVLLRRSRALVVLLGRVATTNLLLLLLRVLFIRVGLLGLLSAAILELGDLGGGLHLVAAPAKTPLTGAA